MCGCRMTFIKLFAGCTFTNAKAKYLAGNQFLSSRFKTKPCWVPGISGEKTFGKYSFFINAENITDTRQSRFGQVVFLPFQNPIFAEIYTHTEGRIFNGGIKMRL